MKILMPSLYQAVGGSTRVLLAAAQALSRKHEVTVRGPFPEAASRHEHAVSSAQAEGLLAQLRLLPQLAKAIILEWRWVRANPADVIYVHDEISLYAYGLIGRLLSIPVIWHVHMLDRAGWRQKIRHGLARAAIYISAHSQQGEFSGPWRLIHNPVELPPLHRAGQPDLTRLCVIGAITPRKNQRLAVDVLAWLRARGFRHELHFYGPEIDAGYAASLRGEISARGLAPQAHFHGMRNAAAIYAQAGVVLLTSTYENQPLVMLEALGHGVPFVAVDLPACREIAAASGFPLAQLQPAEPARLGQAIVELDHLAQKGCAAAVRLHFSAAQFESKVLQFFGESVTLTK